MWKDPGAVTIGVSTSIGGGNHFSAALALQRAGVDLKRVRFVAFKGSAESITAQLAETEEWKADLEGNLWHWNFMDGAKTTAAVSSYAEDVESLVTTLGLRKSP